MLFLIAHFYDVMKYYSLLFFALCLSVSVRAQADYKYIDNTYLEHIRTVTFGPVGETQLLPLIDLARVAPLQLTFDDMDAQVKNYVYTVIHCDRDWQPSSLAPMEYINGFEEENVEYYRFSAKTIQTYTHYEMYIPNENMSLTKSGNYLLVVYENEYDKVPAITRRFVVLDELAVVDHKVVRPTEVSKLHTHQEIDFTVTGLNAGFRSPMIEISATILQNQRWDNAMINIPPKFVRGNDIVFDYQGKLTFPGGNEHRFVDLRSLRRPERSIEWVGQGPDNQMEAVIQEQTSRGNGVFLSFADFNGRFLIDNFDQPDATINSEYVNVLMTYKVTEPYYDDHVYLFGELTEWQIKEEFRLQYNPAVFGYVGKFPLKQGFYDYYFVTAPSARKRGEVPVPSLEKTENSHADTENEYTVLIYYRPFGGRYDQLIGAAVFDTWNRGVELRRR